MLSWVLTLEMAVWKNFELRFFCQSFRFSLSDMGGTFGKKLLSGPWVKISFCPTGCLNISFCLFVTPPFFVSAVSKSNMSVTRNRCCFMLLKSSQTQSLHPEICFSVWLTSTSYLIFLWLSSTRSNSLLHILDKSLCGSLSSSTSLSLELPASLFWWICLSLPAATPPPSPLPPATYWGAGT